MFVVWTVECTDGYLRDYSEVGLVAGKARLPRQPAVVLGNAGDPQIHPYDYIHLFSKHSQIRITCKLKVSM